MNEILLINASGVDKPGVTRAITRVLADVNARILDIGQAVIHDTLALGILVELPIAAEIRAQLLEQIQQATEPLGIQ
ncbi:MAG TPA: ACT domain-containing protein, partial [Cellvibrio sp.]